MNSVGTKMKTTTTAELAAALIAVFEGEKFLAYPDSGGVWTIGIGHTRGVVQGMRSTHEQNLQWFAEDSAALLTAVSGLPAASKAAALVSFGYNCGLSNLKKALANVAEILVPVHTADRHGNVLAGLKSRRQLEYLLCML